MNGAVSATCAATPTRPASRAGRRLPTPGCVSSSVRYSRVWLRSTTRETLFLPPHAAGSTAFDHAAPARLDPACLPQHDGERPGDDEQADDDVADVAEVEVVEVCPEAAGKRELRGGHLEQ